MKDSRFPSFYRKTVEERIDALQSRGFIDAAGARLLRARGMLNSTANADRMVENVIGVFGLPFAVAPNFTINGRDHVVPMVVEEPSVVAGVSAVASLARAAGGFHVRSGESLLFGQVQLCGIDDVDTALCRLRESSETLLLAANDVHPNLAARGGGVRSIEFSRTAPVGDGVHIVAMVAVDTRDAMGANLVNTICERIAPRLELVSGGRANLRILSNLADRALVSASVTLPPAALRAADFSAEQVRDGIISANALALTDPYRAATHNKGIMNGVDAVALATGNDWRAIEAGAHAYACRDGAYRSLTSWTVSDDGGLRGTLTLPLKVGTVGGSLRANPGARLGLAIAGVASARELGEVMAAVGLAQNLAALRALVTAGIQRGHMRLHARSVAAVAGATADMFDEVVAELVRGNDVSESQAIAIVERKRGANLPADPGKDGAWSRAAGKVILLGEHAVVYGRHALALPISNAMAARCSSIGDGLALRIPDWGIVQQFSARERSLAGAAGILRQLLDALAPDADALAFEVRSRLPLAMGLGSSAALAVVLARAICERFELSLGDDEINKLAFACEQTSHGNPSGIDNAIAVYGKPILFRRGDEVTMTTLDLSAPLPLIVAFGETRGVTKQQVADVRSRYEAAPVIHDGLFSQMDALCLAGVEAVRAGEFDALGRCMNVCHGLLNAIGVSTPELETMVEIARSNGAAGAKLTGAGGGGSIVALCPGCEGAVEEALETAGFRTLKFV